MEHSGRHAQYTIGTLSYTMPKLLGVSTIVLIANFFYNIAGYVIVPTLLPLLLDQYGAGAKLIAVTVGSIPAAINAVINPIVSTASDRCRSRWGRRMPFLMTATPFVLMFLLLLGWGPEILIAIHGRFLSSLCSMENFVVYSMVTIASLYIFANYTIGSVVCYLPPDIIPHQFMGRFISALSVVCALAGAAFNYLFLDYAREYSAWIYTIIGVTFAISFLLMFLLVKEGEYPPPAPVTRSGQGITEKTGAFISTYIRECMGHPIFVFFFLGTAITQVSTACRGPFNLLFATKELAMTDGQFGQVMAVGAIVALIAIIFSGQIMDKIMPMWVFIGTGFLVMALNVIGYYYVHDYISFYWIGVPIAVIYPVQGMSAGLCCIALFPPDKYGQFCSANAMVNAAVMVIAGYFAGWAVDEWGYRIMFVWDFIFTLIATAMLFYVYYAWYRLGGKHHDYRPPDRGRRTSEEC